MRGTASVPGQGTKILMSCAAQPKNLKKEREMHVHHYYPRWGNWGPRVWSHLGVVRDRAIFYTWLRKTSKSLLCVQHYRARGGRPLWGDRDIKRIHNYNVFAWISTTSEGFSSIYRLVKTQQPFKVSNIAVYLQIFMKRLEKCPAHSKCYTNICK